VDDRHGAPGGTPIVEQRPSGSLLLAAGAGLGAAAVGGVVWGLVVKWSDYEIGIVAWGIGFLVGAAVVAATRGGKGPALQAIAVVSALAGILLGKYLGFAFVVQEQAEAAGVKLGLLSSELRTLFREDLGSVFGLFDLLWIGLALYTAWRALQRPEPEPSPDLDRPVE
jgi:hypothetical protein